MTRYTANRQKILTFIVESNHSTQLKVINTTYGKMEGNSSTKDSDNRDNGNVTDNDKDNISPNNNWKTPMLESHFNKVVDLLKTRIQHWYFPVNIAEFLKTIFLIIDLFVASLYLQFL